MDTLRLERQENGLAVLFIDEADDKVNKLSFKFMSELGLLLTEIEQDESVKGLILISGKEDNFVVGADIRELEQITEPGIADEMTRKVRDLFYQLETLPFPTLAAIHGPCLGGGLELALACSHRIATDHPKTTLGLPEVKLGLLPAAGGTQRLPRLIGVRQALPLMLTGRALNARQAKKLGIIEYLVYPFDLLGTASSCLEHLSGKHKKDSYYSEMFSLEGVIQNIKPVRKLFFDQARKQVFKKTEGNFPAPDQIIKCVEIGTAVGFAAGLEAEAKAFADLVVSPESLALRQLFFATTALKKNPFAKKARAIQRVGVLGAGLMGSGIAAVSAQHGLEVVLKDITWDNLSRGLKNAWSHLDGQVRRQKQNPVQRDRLYSLITPAVQYDQLKGTEMVIEAVFEDLDLKHQVLSEVEEHTNSECIFASNTSAIPITRIASQSRNPERVIGMHYFSPVPRMPLLEIVVTPLTAEWVTATAVEVGRRQGKTVIIVKDGPGFYTSRILTAFLHEAVSLLHESADIESIDDAIRQFGFPVGPFKLIDEVGIDVGAHVSKELHELFAQRGFQPPSSLQRILESGALGRKSGAGFYRYDKTGIAGKIPIPGLQLSRPVNKAIYEFFGGPNRKTVDMLEIQERLVLMMVNEAVLCLEEGILQSPRDGDVGAVLGLGFPPFLGGPFRYVDRVSANAIVIKLERLADKAGPRFQPARLLSDMALKGKKFF